jgi:hypothetical protein
VSRRRERITRRRRLAVWVLIGVGGLTALSVGWLLVTGLMARGQLDALRAQVRTLQRQVADGDLDAARATASTIGMHAHRAHLLTTGPVWALTADLPGGEPLHLIRVVTASADQLGRGALPQVVRAAQSLDPATLRQSDGGLDLGRIAAAAPELQRADASVAAAVADISRLPARTWFGAADSARTDVLTQVQRLAHTVHSADLAAQLVPPMLGIDGPHSYFVAFQNEAEARGTGGLPGAFAIVVVGHGTVTFTKFGSDAELSGVSATVNLGSDYEAMYAGANTTTKFSNSNLSPNFPYAAQIWASMWQKRSGRSVDGVIAVDPTALAYVLDVDGPARLADGTMVSGTNVVALTQSTLYAKYPALSQVTQRRDYLLGIARAVSVKIAAQHGDATPLIKALSRAAGERRLLVWSASSRLESMLGQSSVGGEIPTTASPYAGLSIVNDGGNKLDYYLDRSLSWTSTGCDRTRAVTVTIRLTNTAPTSGLSPYVTYRSDRHSYPIKPGGNRLEVGYIATSHAQLEAVTVDGHPATARADSERGHPVFTVDLELPRGATSTIELHLAEPSTPGPVQVLDQPLVRPLHVSVNEPSC